MSPSPPASSQPRAAAAVPSDVLSPSILTQLKMAYVSFLRKASEVEYAGKSSVKKHVCEIGKHESGFECSSLDIVNLSLPKSAFVSGSRDRPQQNRRKAACAIASGTQLLAKSN